MSSKDQPSCFAASGFSWRPGDPLGERDEEPRISGAKMDHNGNRNPPKTHSEKGKKGKKSKQPVGSENL